MDRNKIYGGVVNRTGQKDNFDSILEMLLDETSKITTVSVSSGTGFVFKLHKPIGRDDLVEFYALNPITKVFDQPVDTIIIKMAILNAGRKKKRDGLMLPDYKNRTNPNEDRMIGKWMNNLDEFKEEGLVQSQVYHQSLSKGVPICPSLIDLSIFDGHVSTVSFLKRMIKKCDRESKHIIQYLIQNISTQQKQILGMITMEFAKTYSPFYTKIDIVKKLADGPMRIELLCVHAMVPIIRLFNECGIVHCDLHGANLMINTINIILIDFGQQISIHNLTVDQKRRAKYFLKQNYDNETLFRETEGGKDFELSEIVRYSVTEFTVDYLKLIIQLILSLEYAFGKVIWGSDATYIQENLLNYLNEDSYSKILQLLNAYYATPFTCQTSEMSKVRVLDKSGEFHKTPTKNTTLCEYLSIQESSPESSPESSVSDGTEQTLDTLQKYRKLMMENAQYNEEDSGTISELSSLSSKPSSSTQSRKRKLTIPKTILSLPYKKATRSTKKNKTI